MVNATPRPFCPRERPGAHRIGGWVGPRAGLDGSRSGHLAMQFLQSSPEFNHNRARAHNLLLMLRYLGDSRVLNTITIRDEKARQFRIMATENVCRKVTVNCRSRLTFRDRACCILGQAFHYSPENAFYIFNQQIYFII